MTAFIIILILFSAVMLILFILQKKELKNIIRQLEKLKNENKNTHIYSETGMADDLINEINSLLDEVNEMRVNYQKKNHSLEQMITNISHDLRTPLTSALGYINLIQHSGLSEDEKKRELEIIEKRLIRLEELISSFFEMSKIISVGKEPEKSEINLVSVIEEAAAHYYDDYCNNNRNIIFDCCARKIKLYSNQNMLLRIFDNLIGNALKHGKGDLTISVKNDPGKIEIAFKNGFTEQNLDTKHIFDEFYTTDISRTKGNTGLGLAIAKQLTEMLGGEIQAFQHENQLMFTIGFVNRPNV